MKYRAEIDGLRAIAVIPVILFHAGLPVFSGGFIGVDVFFVISGYLITSIILSEMEQGTFSIANFYERRARRILPALFLVMLVSLPFAWLLLLPSAMKSFSDSLIAVSMFSSNILFWHESGYWDSSSELKPLLHTWSLAVEEQYYVFFPLFLMAMWRFRKRWMFGSFVLLACVSLVLAQWGAYYSPTAAFYLLPTRGWELAIGAGLAFYFLYHDKLAIALLSNKLVNEAFGLLGLMMIVYSILVFNDKTPFPSVYTLIPTVGTGLVILFSSSQTLVGRLLSTKVLVGVGLISYSAYLWHQPLFAFERHRSFAEPSELSLLGLAFLAIPLAYLTWRFVERPFRNKSKINKKAIFILSVVGSFMFIAIGAYGHKSDGFISRVEMPLTVLHSIKRNPATCFDRAYAHENASWLCHISQEDSYYSASSTPKFLALGDSHMYATLPALQIIADKNNVMGAYVGFSGCPPLLGLHSLRKDQEKKNCNQLNSRVFEYIKAASVSDIILIARWTYYTDGDYEGGGLNYLGSSPSDNKSKERSREVLTRALYQTLHTYNDIGVRVHLLSQVPMQKDDPLKIYRASYFTGAFHSTLFSEHAVTLKQHQQFNGFISPLLEKLALEFTNLYVYDPSDILCEKGRCLAGSPDVSYYFDDDHLSFDGAEFLGHQQEIEFTGIFK